MRRHELPQDTNDENFTRRLAEILAKAEDGDEIVLPSMRLCAVAADTLQEVYPDKDVVLMSTELPHETGEIILMDEVPPFGEERVPEWVKGLAEEAQREAQGRARSLDEWVHAFQNEHGREPTQEEFDEWNEQESLLNDHELYLEGWFNSLFSGFVETVPEQAFQERQARLYALIEQASYLTGRAVELYRQSAVMEGKNSKQVVREMCQLSRKSQRKAILETTNCPCPECQMRRAREAERESEEEG